MDKYLKNSNSYNALNEAKSEMIAFRNQTAIGLLLLVILGSISILICSMNIFLDKKILLIICGGISAYKSLELIRSLKKKGAKVKKLF